MNTVHEFKRERAQTIADAIAFNVIAPGSPLKCADIDRETHKILVSILRHMGFEDGGNWSSTEGVDSRPFVNGGNLRVGVEFVIDRQELIVTRVRY